MKRALVGVALVLCSPCLLGQARKPVAVAAWRADIRTLARELPRRHPGPFARITQAQWDSSVTAFERRLPSLTRNQVLVGVLRLVALIGDAHTAVEPDPSLGLRYYPIELYSFDDGLFVRRADSSHAGLVGAKVLGIGRATLYRKLGKKPKSVPCRP